MKPGRGSALTYIESKIVQPSYLPPSYSEGPSLSEMTGIPYHLVLYYYGMSMCVQNRK